MIAPPGAVAFAAALALLIPGAAAGLAALPAPGADAPAFLPLCAAGLPRAAWAGVPGTFHESAHAVVEHERQVELDERTVLHVLALARFLEEDVEVLDVANYSERTVARCVFERSAVADREGVLAALALGVDLHAGAVLGLAEEVALVVTYEARVEQTVAVDRDVTLAALAIGRPLRLDDVVDVHREARLERAVVQTVELALLDEADALTVGSER